MIRFQSLEASGLSGEFDAQVHGEQPVVTVTEEDDTIALSYVFPGFTVADDDTEVNGTPMAFREVGISGAGFVSESGKPLLPSFGRFVQVPPGCDFEVEVKKNKAVVFDDVLITPAQANATDGDTDEFEYDHDAYAQDRLYPEKIVEVTGPQDLDDYQVLLVHVRPLQYNAAKRTLHGYGNITIRITLTAKDQTDEDQFDEYAFADPPTNREAFGNLLVNPRRRILERLERIRRPEVIRPWIRPRGPEFLIIFDPALETPAEKLARWKRRGGLRTETVSIATVGNTVAQIKAYIRNRRRFLFSRLRYVLLFGDIEAIATEQLPGCTTDYYFFTARDAAGGSECLIPWVSGGRIPVRTEAEGLATVDQIIGYEKQPPSESEYYRRMTFAGYFQDNAPQDGKADRAYIKTLEGIREHMTDLGFDVQRVYVSNNADPEFFKDGTPVPLEVRDAIVDDATATAMMISELSDGQLVVGHRDHAWEQGWNEPPLTVTHLGSIVGHRPSVFYSINCRSGRFDAEPVDCFAEAILKLNGGAPSLIAATEYSNTWRNDSMTKALFDAMWPGVLPTFPGTTASYGVRHNRLGDILNYARSYLLVAHGANSGTKVHFEMYHVIGDPTIQLWAHEPRSLGVRARIVRGRLHVHTGTCPKGTVVTVWYRDKLLRRLEPSSTSLVIPLNDLWLRSLQPFEIPHRRNLTVCVWAPGYRFAQRSLRFVGPRVPLRPRRIVVEERPAPPLRVPDRTRPAGRKLSAT